MSSVGTFGWGGAATTWYRIDPQEDFIAMFFSQQIPMASALVPPFANSAWQAIIE
jgi:CubicO group peptidase (beta-lactamase class C family)